MSRFDPDKWGMSVCTVDGQRFTLGDVNEPFTIQSCSKPFTYGINLDKLGQEVVDKYIGQEPSGRDFNEICLDSKSQFLFNCVVSKVESIHKLTTLIFSSTDRPHNPMLNAGAILSAGVAATLVEPDMTNSEKFDYIQQYFKVCMLCNCIRTYL